MAEAEEPAALEEAEANVAKLVDLEDYYFGADKEEKVAGAKDAAIAAAESVLAEKPGVAAQARALCVKGRALAFASGGEQQAEELLSKALKLSPQLVEAWNALGEVYWNQQSYAQARSSFEQALELCGPNVVSLRNLSMVLRAVGGDDLEREANYALGLQKAKEATVLGADDPQNWETLGNAYMGEFFVNGKRSAELTKALIAYARAEKAYEKLGKRNPTMHLNRGTCAKFLEDYDLALRSFSIAREIGAGKGQEEADSLVELVRRLAGLVERKGDLKTKRLRELTTHMPQSSALQLQSKEQAVQQSIAAKVVSVIDRSGEIPVMLVCCDSAGKFFVLSIYNAEQAGVFEAVTELQTNLEISKPHYREIRVKVGSSELTYPSIRVAHPVDVKVFDSGQNLSTAASKPGFTSERAQT